MAQWFAIAKEIKDSINNKIGGVTNGIMQAGNIYGNVGNLGFTPSNQQQNQAPLIDTSKVSNGGGFSSLYSLPTKNYQIQNTDFANRIMGKTDNNSNFFDDKKQSLYDLMTR